MVSMQYLYWEKVHPPNNNGQKLQSPNLSVFPLMKNWNEFAANMRDDYDCKHGRGLGKVNPLCLVRISFLCVYTI